MRASAALSVRRDRLLERFRVRPGTADAFPGEVRPCVPREHEEEVRELPRGPVALAVPVGPQERLLDEVFGFIHTSAHAQEKVHQPALVSSDELGEGVAVAEAGAGHQVGVRGFFRSHGLGRSGRLQVVALVCATRCCWPAEMSPQNTSPPPSRRASPLIAPAARVHDSAAKGEGKELHRAP